MGLDGGTLWDLSVGLDGGTCRWDLVGVGSRTWLWDLDSLVGLDGGTFSQQTRNRNVRSRWRLTDR